MAGELDPPVEVRFCEGDTPKRFESLGALKDWLEESIAIWNGLHDQIAPPKTPNAMRQFSRQIKSEAIDHLTQALIRCQSDPLDSPAALAAIRNSLSQFSQSGPPDMVSAWGIMIREKIDDEPLLALAMVFARSPKFLTAQNYGALFSNQDLSSHFLQPFIKGHIAAGLFENGLPGRAEAEAVALAALKAETEDVNTNNRNLLDQLQADANALEAEIAAFDKRTNQSLSDLSERMDTLYLRLRKVSGFLVGRMRRRLDDIREYYRTELALQEPVHFWTAKATGHRNAAFAWGAVFAVAAGGLVLGLVFSLDRIRDFLTAALPQAGTTGSGGLERLAILAAPAFLIVWLLRLVARQFHTNVNEMHDAKGRVVMAETYLALLEHGKVDPEDRILILHALFRPPLAATGEDSAPPHWFDLLMDRVKPNK